MNLFSRSSGLSATSRSDLLGRLFTAGFRVSFEKSFFDESFLRPTSEAKKRISSLPSGLMIGIKRPVYQSSHHLPPPSTTIMPAHVNSTTVAAATIATIIVLRSTWKHAVPSWVKKNITRSDDDEDEDADDDLANPKNIVLKIRDMMKISHEMCGDLIPDEMPWYKLYCSFMTMIHLMNELDANHPDFRENYFAKEGKDVDEQELETLTKYLDFAEWAYDPDLTSVKQKLKSMGYQLVRHDANVEVGYYIAVHHEKKQVVLAIKGTASIRNVLTDIIGKAVPHSIEGADKSHRDIRCHEGLYVAANMMLDDTLHLLEHFFLPQNYQLIICGHSLGAGVSSLLGILVKEKLPKLKLQVYAYATPACLSYQAALGCESFITSVVNNNDCVPRLSLLNVRLMNKLFILLNQKLQEKGLSPDNFQTAKKCLQDLMTIDQDSLLPPKELMDFLDQEVVESNEHRDEAFQDIQLFVPGRVVSIWNHTSDESVVGGRVGHGGMQVLRQVFVVSNMMSDHGIISYRKNLEHLLEQAANTI